MKKVLIGGCSFSQTQEWPNNRFDIPWIPWTDLFVDEYKDKFKIVNTAQSSFGQSKIVESLIKELIKYNFDVDYVIIQWSAVGRSYSLTETDFVEKVLNQGEETFAPYMHEYLIGSRDDGDHWVTNSLKTISNHFYISSLNQIFLMKSLLEHRMIPYKMFWGWQQITPEIENDTKDLLNLIYNDSFLRFGNEHGGMSEWILANMSKEEGQVSKTDFHPSTKGQEFFYNTIIKNIIKEI